MTEENNAQEEVQEQNTGASDQVAADNSKDTNWSKAREAMAEQSQTIKALQSQLEQLKQSSQQPKQESFNNVDDDELITVKDLKKALSEKDQTYSQQLAELKARAKYPDFEKVVSKYGKKLPEAVRSAILKSSDPYTSAYEACINSSEYYKDQVSDSKSEYTQKIKSNLNKPGSASAAGGTGAVSQNSMYQNMSLSEIRALANKRASGG